MKDAKLASKIAMINLLSDSSSIASSLEAVDKPLNAFVDTIARGGASGLYILCRLSVSIVIRSNKSTYPVLF